MKKLKINTKRYKTPNMCDVCKNCFYSEYYDEPGDICDKCFNEIVDDSIINGDWGTS
jgi:hypothetical protein